MLYFLIAISQPIEGAFSGMHYSDGNNFQRTTYSIEDAIGSSPVPFAHAVKLVRYMHFACKQTEAPAHKLMSACNFLRVFPRDVGTELRLDSSDNLGIRRVLGVESLRVVDASVMPNLPSGNTMAPSYMVGSKAAEMIKEEWDKKWTQAAIFNHCDANLIMINKSCFFLWIVCDFILFSDFFKSRWARNNFDS